MAGEVLRAVRAVDTATDPDYQGQGLFTALTMHGLDEVRADGVDFVFNTPNDQSRPGYLKMGWQTVGELPVAVRIPLADGGAHDGAIERGLVALAAAPRMPATPSMPCSTGDRSPRPNRRVPGAIVTNRSNAFVSLAIRRRVPRLPDVASDPESCSSG